MQEKVRVLVKNLTLIYRQFIKMGAKVTRQFIRIRREIICSFTTVTHFSFPIANFTLFKYKTYII